METSHLYCLKVRSTGNNLGVPLGSEVEGGLMGLRPFPV